MNTTNKITLSIVATAPIGGIAAALLPAPGSWHGSWFMFHVPLAMTLLTMWLHCGAAILFLAALDAYKTQLRYAYIALSFGIVVTALGTLQLAILDGFNLWLTPWVTRGGVVLPFLLTGLAIYLGMRQLSRATQTQTVFARALVVFPVVIALSALSALVPHAHVQTPEQSLDIANGITLWTALLDLTAACIVLKVKQRIGQHYTNAMAWLFIVLFVSCVILIVSAAQALFIGGISNWFTLFIDSIAILLGFLWTKAGYAFNRTKEV